MDLGAVFNGPPSPIVLFLSTNWSGHLKKGNHLMKSVPLSLQISANLCLPPFHPLQYRIKLFLHGNSRWIIAA